MTRKLNGRESVLATNSVGDVFGIRCVSDILGYHFPVFRKKKKRKKTTETRGVPTLQQSVALPFRGSESHGTRR